MRAYDGQGVLQTTDGATRRSPPARPASTPCRRASCRSEAPAAGGRRRVCPRRVRPRVRPRRDRPRRCRRPGGLVSPRSAPWAVSLAVLWCRLRHRQRCCSEARYDSALRTPAGPPRGHRREGRRAQPPAERGPPRPARSLFRAGARPDHSPLRDRQRVLQLRGEPAQLRLELVDLGLDLRLLVRQARRLGGDLRRQLVDAGLRRLDALDDGVLHRLAARSAAAARRGRRPRCRAASRCSAAGRPPTSTSRPASCSCPGPRRAARRRWYSPGRGRSGRRSGRPWRRGVCPWPTTAGRSSRAPRWGCSCSRSPRGSRPGRAPPARPPSALMLRVRLFTLSPSGRPLRPEWRGRVQVEHPGWGTYRQNPPAIRKDTRCVSTLLYRLGSVLRPALVAGAAGLGCASSPRSRPAG